MHNNYHIIITPHDKTSLMSNPLKFLPGDTDSVEILRPYSDENEEFNPYEAPNSPIPNEFPNEDPYFYPKIPSKNKPTFKIEPNFLSDRIEENLALLLKKGSLSVNNSFSFANGLKNISDIEESPINHLKRPNSFNAPHVTDRLFRLSRVLKEQKEWKIQQNQQKSLENCSFKPKINKKSSSMALTRSSQNLLSLKTQNNSLIPSTLSLNPLENKEIGLNNPQTKANRINYINNKENIQLNSRNNENTNPNSQKSKLYLKNYQLINPPPNKGNTPKPTRKTLQKAAEHFKREYDSILNSIMISHSETTKNFTREQILQMLYTFGFITPTNNPKNQSEKLLLEEMWLLLENPHRNQRISTNKLFKFLLCVMGLNPNKMNKSFEESLLQKPNEVKGGNLAIQLTKDDEKVNIGEEIGIIQQDFSTEDDQCRYKSPETMKSLEYMNINNPKILIEDLEDEDSSDYRFNMNEIHAKYQLFNRNRLMSQKEQTFKDKIELNPFKPNILRNSKELAIKSREKLRMKCPLDGNNNKNLFEMYQEQKKAKINSLFKRKLEDITEKCTFNPNSFSKNPLKRNSIEKTGFIKNLACPKVKIPERNPDDIDYEKAKKEFTFKPNILLSKASNSSKTKTKTIKKDKNKINNEERGVFMIDIKLNEDKREKIWVLKDTNLTELITSFTSKHGFFYNFF